MAQIHLPFPINDKSIKVEYSVPSKYAPVTTVPVQANYTPIGEKFKINQDLECYITGDSKSNAAIIYCFDVFGLSDNILQAADILGKSGYRVIVPNYWNNKSFPPDLMGEDILLRAMEYDELSPSAVPNDETTAKALKVKAFYEDTKQDIDAAKNYLIETENFKNIFIVGECLGGKVAKNAAEKDNFYIGLGLIHPSMVNNENIKKSEIPTILFAGSDDPDYTQGIEFLNKKGFGKFNNYQIYHYVAHGWASSVADLSDPTIAKRLNETLGLLVAYLNQILSSQ
ncbi:hypothetical protein BB560_005801 [Smittium megazygosporum]|uniref:Dienelactone hydrolase domain-containing protein n=2 Tax=Smittium megazygosporum TaxID=133381 RepID=A0A2T9YW13_9FUNG|nr:hypothetical protein BB560_005801 [Smittium megazygosporum]